MYKFSASKPRELDAPITELRLLTKEGSSLHFRVNFVTKIADNLKRACLNPENYSHLLKDIPLANSVPSTEETANTELLLGDYYYYEADRPGLNFMESKLGYTSRPSSNLHQ